MCNKTANSYMQLFQNNSVFASKEKDKEQIITCGFSKQLCVELQLSQLSLKNVSLPTFIRTPLTGHLFFWDIWGAGQLWHRDVILDNAP